MARTRTQSFAGFRGTRQPGTQAPVLEPSWTQSTATCIDSLGRNTDHALTINKSQYDLVPYNGFSSGSLATRVTYVAYAADTRAFLAMGGGHLTLPPSVSDASITSTVLSRTNPSRADISVPNFVYELKDLPGMLHDIMAIKLKLRKAIRQRDLKRYAANSYLAGVMGWQPLISDIRKMLDFQRRVDRRIKELRHLYSSGGSRRTIRQGLDSATVSQGDRNVILTSLSGGSLIGDRSAITTRNTWATVRWTPTVVPKDLSNPALQRQARDLVFGLNIQPRHLWDALPWSWLIDWFTNTGDFINSYSAVVPAKSSLPCIMRHTKTVKTGRRTDGVKTISGGYGTYTLESKTRTIGTLSLSASLPFLSRRQMSILGALTVQRLKR